MTIRHLRIFLEVSIYKNMSKAAESLHFSQSTVSQVIKELEEHYNTTLFERLSKRLYITEGGKKLKSHAKKVLEEFDKLENEMAKESGIEHIRFGTTITCGCCILPTLLKDFQSSFPSVDMTSYIYNTHIIEESILNGDLDIALVEGKIRSKELICTPVIDDYLVLAFGKKHEFASKKSFLPEDLLNRDFVVREKGSGTREKFEDYLLKHNVSIKSKVEAPFPEAMRQAIIHNNCLAVISKRLIENEIKDGEINFLRLTSNEWNRHFSLVYRKDKNLTDAIKYIFHLLSNLKN